MAIYEADARDRRVFHPTSTPDYQRIGLHLADRGVHEEPRDLWFVVEGAKVMFHLDSVRAFWAPGPPRLDGTLRTWKKHPECSMRTFSLNWDKVRSRYHAELTVYDVTPFCEVCKGRTRRQGWSFVCPQQSCSFSMLDPNAPTQADPPWCMQCGLEMTKVGNLYTCSACGSTHSPA